jgi:hypothetical protein
MKTSVTGMSIPSLDCIAALADTAGSYAIRTLVDVGLNPKLASLT